MLAEGHTTLSTLSARPMFSDDSKLCLQPHGATTAMYNDMPGCCGLFLRAWCSHATLCPPRYR